MTIKDQQSHSVTGNLQNVFNYTFVETTMYYFIVPKSDKYAPIRVSKKNYKCSACGESHDVSFKHDGNVHIEKSRLSAQKNLYAKLGLSFPAVEKGEPIVYQQIGYCENCYEKCLKNTEDDRQAIYNLCKQVNQLDNQFVVTADELFDKIILSWLESITDVEQLTEYNLSGYMAIREVLVKLIVSNEDAVQYVKDYQEKTAALAKMIHGYLTRVNETKFDAFVGKPLDIYESMAEEIYNEYTVLFPVDGTPSIEFYSESNILKERVIMFLDQQRIDSVTMLINETGFSDKWVEWLAERISKITG
ncbi:hypothetical protein [Dendrosporobacter sp. 1207_IL3150]|uniref:hypothetical protein n=1 Tax=Dendrosporobacter sp. 1207_IL3150 TaxID=3084054 RepID=UPI002FD97BC6